MKSTRKAYFIKFNSRAADKNVTILDSLVKKRDELGKLMGYPTFASFNLVPKMAKDPRKPFGNLLMIWWLYQKTKQKKM
jgi:Zn-dependent oligopeptidase